MTPRAALTKHLLDGDDSILHRQLRQRRPPGTDGAAGSSRPFDRRRQQVKPRVHAGRWRRGPVAVRSTVHRPDGTPTSGGADDRGEPCGTAATPDPSGVSS